MHFVLTMSQLRSDTSRYLPSIIKQTAALMAWKKKKVKTQIHLHVTSATSNKWQCFSEVTHWSTSF